MASAGIDISITGNATAFLASLRAAEAATREVSNAAEAASAREEAAYRRAAAEAAGRARAQVEAARAVQRAEREAAAAAAAAARQGTEAARAEARVKAQALSAARAAAAAAQQQAAAALAAAQAQQRAMGAASRAALDAAEAYRRAADAAAAAAAAAGRGNPPPGGGPPPPPPGGGGGNPPPGGGRGGRGGGGGPPPGGGRRGGGGGGLGNTSGAMDANMAYQIIQDTWQGGFAGVANQIPQLLGLLAKYGKVLGGIGGILAVGVGLGKAIVDPQGFLKSLSGFTDAIDNLKGAIIRPDRARAKLEEWLASFDEMTKTAKAMDEKLKAFNIARDLAQAKQRGAATGSNAEGLANAARAGAEGRASTLGRNLTVREQAAELERVRIEGILNEEQRRKAMAEFEAKAAMEQALIRKKAAEEEFAIRERENKAAHQALSELEARAKKEKLPDGVSGTTKALEEINAARPGVESRANSAKDALTEAGKAVSEAAAAEQAAAHQAEVEKRRMANEDAARAAEKAQQESARRLKRFWDDFENAIKTGIENAKRAAAEAASKKEMDQDLEVLQLRARGRNLQADKLQKERDIQKIAKEYKGDNPKISNEQARAYAEQMYDVTHDKGRIRGVGRKIGTQSTPAFGIDNPGFTPGKLGVQPSSPGAFPGLDGLNELQKRNRRIRGAGHKEDDRPGEPPATATTGNPIAALGSVIISKLSSIQSTLERSTPGKQTRTR